MPEKTSVSATEELKNDTRFKFFRRIISAPYLLALLGLLLPLMNVSCAEKVIAEPSFYEVATGADLRETLKEPAKGYLLKMEKDNPKALDRFRTSMPEFPKLQPMPVLFGIVAALVLAAVFAWFTPLGSLTLGILAMCALWALLAQMGSICANIGMQVLQVEPGHGIYAASVLILIGTAMNLAAIIRPIVVEVKAKRAVKNAVGQ
ncbi:hypothetical protein SAMN05720472_1921 [Fibrobacter sp. UWR3]|uniref:hypothetical protein n=1 Tax=Fibrobacter sp. UWR3 TaxID=1896217 RepID=UPI000911A7ED|nr:hypothetical protein [Fibrobacter sp. UWR3]SHM67192.1 hypothetical protein SAMN05720472_1921 [Fibrobacter sp. UWR3]